MKLKGKKVGVTHSNNIAPGFRVLSLNEPVTLKKGDNVYGPGIAKKTTVIADGKFGLGVGGWGWGVRV